MGRPHPGILVLYFGLGLGWVRLNFHYWLLNEYTYSSEINSFSFSFLEIDMCGFTNSHFFFWFPIFPSATRNLQTDLRLSLFQNLGPVSDIDNFAWSSFKKETPSVKKRTNFN